MMALGVVIGMKKLIVIIVSIVFIVNLLACSNDRKNSSASTPISAAEAEVRHVSSSDILKITEEMTYGDMMNLLGETVYKTGARGWFLYRVDDMQYLQPFSDNGNGPKKSGAEILEKIKKQNHETPPKFISIKEAAGVLETISAGIDPWNIMFADSNYIYVRNSDGLLTFRYNIKENKTDKALDCRGYNIYEAPTDLISIGGSFAANGQYAIFSTRTSGEEGDSLEFREIFPFEYMYRVDFENDDVTLIPKDSDVSKVLSEEERYKPYYIEDEDTEKHSYEYNIQKKYTEALKSNHSLPTAEPGTWTAAAQIDDDRFCLVKQINGEIPGEGYGYVKFIIVDVKQGKVIQECALSRGLK